MAPYFETAKSFADVPVTDKGVDTVQFLEAADGLVNMFDLLGSLVFGFVQTDLRENISGVRSSYHAKPQVRNTLEELVYSEVADRQKHGIDSLRRLTRGLAFTCASLQHSRANERDEMHICFKRAYDTVLRRHHNFAIRTVVTVALKACPRRVDFYARIAQGGSQESLTLELDKWLAGLDLIVKHLSRFYEEGGHGSI